MSEPDLPSAAIVEASADSRMIEPPEFPGRQVGSGLAQLQGLSKPWSVARVSTAPTLTQQILAIEPDFDRLPRFQIGAIANTLTFLFNHTMTWTLVWARSEGGPGHFEQTESVAYGVSAEQGLELARTVGMKVGADFDFLAGSVSSKLSAEWSKLTRSTVRIEARREADCQLSYDIPAGGMDIALWRLDSMLTRQLILRPGKHLPLDPLPHWVDIAIAARVILINIPTEITQTKTRITGIIPPAQPARQNIKL